MNTRTACSAHSAQEMVGSRVKNEATPKDVLKVMRLCYKSLDVVTFNMPEYEMVIRNHVEFIRGVLQLTRRPNEKLLESAGLMIFPDQASYVKMFAGQICKAVAMCRQKKNRVTTGSRQIPEVLEVIKLLGEEPSPVSLEKQETSLFDPTAGQHPSKPVAESPPLELSPGRILSAYGVKASKKHSNEQVPQQIVDVLSSQEDADALQTSETQFASSSSQPSKGPKATIYLDSTKRALVRVISGQLQVAEMRHGPGGFAIGCFAGETVEHISAMPNLLLSMPEGKPNTKNIFKRPAGKKTKGKSAAKKPRVEHQVEDAIELAEDEEEAAQEQEDEANDTDDVLAPTQEYNEDGSPSQLLHKYSKMWYKANKSVAIRQCFLNRSQIFSFRSPDGSFGEDALWELADEVLAKLGAGDAPAHVRRWLIEKGLKVSNPKS